MSIDLDISKYNLLSLSVLSGGEVSGGLLVHPVHHWLSLGLPRQSRRGRKYESSRVCLAIVRVNNAEPSSAQPSRLEHFRASELGLTHAVYGHYSATSNTSLPGLNYLQLYGAQQIC